MLAEDVQHPEDVTALSPPLAERLRDTRDLILHNVGVFLGDAATILGQNPRGIIELPRFAIMEPYMLREFQRLVAEDRLTLRIPNLNVAMAQALAEVVETPCLDVRKIQDLSPEAVLYMNRRHREVILEFREFCLSPKNADALQHLRISKVHIRGMKHVGGVPNAKRLSQIQTPHLEITIEECVPEEAARLLESSARQLVFHIGNYRKTGLGTLQQLLKDSRTTLHLATEDITVPLAKLMSANPERLLIEETSRPALSMQAKEILSASGHPLLRRFADAEAFDEPAGAPRRETKKDKLSQTLRALPAEAWAQIEPWIDTFEQHRNIKGFVVGVAREELDGTLREHGVQHPECFQNLNALHNIHPVLAQFFEVLSLKIPQQYNRAGFEKDFLRKYGVDFAEDAEFTATYKDEIIQAMADHLHGLLGETPKPVDRAQKLADAKAKEIKLMRNLAAKPDNEGLRRGLEELRATIQRLETSEDRPDEKPEWVIRTEALLAQFDAFTLVSPGKGGFRWINRMRDDLATGDLCGDCFSATIGGVNFWTVPAYEADPCTNTLLHYDEHGDLAHKLILTWEVEMGGNVILTVDAYDLANAQKRRDGMYETPKDPEREEALKLQVRAFLPKLAELLGMGPDSICGITFSNAGPDVPYSDCVKRTRAVAKLNGVRLIEHVVAAANPEKGCTFQPEILIQSLKPITNRKMPVPGPVGEWEGAQTVDIRRPDTVDRMLITEEAIDWPILQRVEAVLDEFLRTPADNEVMARDQQSLGNILRTARYWPGKAAATLRKFLVKERSERSHQTLRLLSIDGMNIIEYLDKHHLSFKLYATAVLTATKRQHYASVSEVKETKCVQTVLYCLGETKVEFRRQRSRDDTDDDDAMP